MTYFFLLLSSLHYVLPTYLRRRFTGGTFLWFKLLLDMFFRGSVSVYSPLTSVTDQNWTIVTFSMTTPSFLSELNSHGREGVRSRYRRTVPLRRLNPLTITSLTPCNVTLSQEGTVSPFVGTCLEWVVGGSLVNLVGLGLFSVDRVTNLKLKIVRTDDVCFY